MALTLYKKKRNFGVTPEPEGKTKEKKDALVFVVQKHHASHLHYDFRLEMDGVLKSWAVPKGPSMNPGDKRLAMMVEDHPYDYKDFEGNIPEGNYGGGNVIVWDNGTYNNIDGEKDKSLNEKTLREGLKKGDLKFILHGKKLKGSFALVRMKSARQDNVWLLIKKADKYASEEDITKKDKSVISKVTLETLAKKYGNDKTGEVLSAKAKKSKKTKGPAIKKRAAVKKKPALVKPMLAKLTEAAFDDKDWVFEIKYDGYRALAACNGAGDVELYSRNLLSFNKDFAPVAANLEGISHSCLLDGEVVVEDGIGKSQFQLLQNYQNTKSGKLKYYVFDLLQLDGNDLTHLPLLERKELLRMLLKGEKLKDIFYSDHVKEKGLAFFDAAIKKNLEGIIAKDAQSPYRVNKRSSEWLKIKITKEQEAVIAGFTAPKGARNHFGALLLAVYNGSEFEYIGNCGTGFDDKTLNELYKKFQPLFTGKSPFKEKITAAGKIQWLKPKLVCQVKFTEWTGDGSMRHPVFLGLRKDKKATEVIREIPCDMKTKSAAKKTATVGADDSGKLKAGDSELKVGKTILKLTNQNKLYWPDEKITKGDLVKYYDEISGLILPYMKDRPQSLHRFPNGIKDAGFYQKDIDKDKVPDWLTTEKVYSESNKEYIDYLICNDKATLLYMANLGCIEMHPWNSRIQSPENPDWVVIDLDPEDIAFKEVVKAAQETRKLLDKLEIDSYCKTSGSTGLHIYIPLAAKYDYEIAKNFAQLIAQQINDVLPDTTSILRMPAKRKKKVYLDFLQNRRGQTLAAPYSVRPKPGATVSTPLDWSEVNAKLDVSKFTIKTIFKRLDKVGDLWKPVLGEAANLDKAVKKIYDGL